MGAKLGMTNRTGEFVDPGTMAVIRLMARGWPHLYKYNGNLLQNRSVTRSKLPRAAQVIAGRKVLFAGRNKKYAGGR